MAGDLESAPVLRASSEDGCFYEFEWHTAAACVLSRTEGDNCTVFDSQAGVCLSGVTWTCSGFCFNVFCKRFRPSLL